MGYPAKKMEHLNGLVQYGHVGPVRMIQGKGRTFMYAPFIRTNISDIRPDSTKALIYPDQIFFLNVEGDPKECLRYSCQYPDFTYDRSPSAWTGDKPGVIAIQIPRSIRLIGIETTHWAARGSYITPLFPDEHGESQHGQIQVCFGNDVSASGQLLHNFRVEDDGTRKAEVIKITRDAQRGNVLLIEVGPNTEIPYFIFRVTTGFQVNAMPDAISSTPTKALSPMMATEKASKQRPEQNPYHTDNPFRTTVHKASIDKMVFKQGLRFNPAFGYPGWDECFYFDYDLERTFLEKANSYLKMADWPESFKGKTEHILGVVKEFMYRYGSNKKIKKETRPVDIITPFIPPPNVKEKPTINKSRVGLGYITGIHLDGIFSDDPFEMGRQQKALFLACKEIDPKVEVGMVVPADRNFLYFATQHMRTKLKKQYFNYLVIKFKSYEELWEMYSILGMCNTYFPDSSIGIVLELDFDFDWKEYMAFIYICAQWRVRLAVLNSFESNLKAAGIGQDYLEFTKWLAMTRKQKLTRIHVFEDSVHAICIDMVNGIKKHILCRGINTGGKKMMYNDMMLEMPLICNGRSFDKPHEFHGLEYSKRIKQKHSEPTGKDHPSDHPDK